MQAYRVARIIEQLAGEARRNRSDAESALADMRRQQLTIREQIAAAYHQIAGLVLQESPELGELQSVQTLLDRLKQEIQSTRAELSRREGELQEQQASHLKLQEQIEPLEAEREQRIIGTPEVQRARQALAELQEQAATLAHDHEELQSEVAQKRHEYEQARLFMFLLSRKFTQPEYRAWPPARRLDAWLGRVTRFPDNYANYRMLGALLERSTQRLNAVQTELTERTAAHREQVKEIEEQLELPHYYQRLESAEQALTAGAQRVAQQQARLEQYARGEGETFDAVTAQLSQLLAQLPQDKLDLLVGKTATPEDDRLLEMLRQRQREEQQLAGQVRDRELQSIMLRTRADLAGTLENEFYQKGYGAAQLEYDWGMFGNPEALIAGYLAGSISIQDVFQKLNSIARRRTTASAPNIDIFTPRSPGRSSGPFSGSSPFGTGPRFPSSGSSSGGGFHTSSSSGGGGFRTTDSF